jgi:hypothetical protein
MGKPPYTLPRNKVDRAYHYWGQHHAPSTCPHVCSNPAGCLASCTKATNNPKFKQQCLQPEPDLLPSFADHYEKLKALPRRMRRSLQRQWKRSLAGVALLMALGQAPAIAATINVGGACTLVRAINAANNGTRANGRCRKGSDAAAIVLPRLTILGLLAGELPGGQILGRRGTNEWLQKSEN